MKLTVKQKKALEFLTEREVVENPIRSEVPDYGIMKCKMIVAKFKDDADVIGDEKHGTD